MPDAKTNKLSIYLIKPEFQGAADIVDCSELPVTIPGVGQFFFERSNPHPPGWVNGFFGGSLDGTLNILASSARGLLLVPVLDGTVTKHFVVSFGVGRFLLKEGVIEERFGLKVVLNSVDPSSFRSISKTTLSSVPKHSHEQMSKTVTPAEFGIDIEQDLISSVTGLSRDPVFGKSVTGKDALSVSVKVDATNIRNFLAHCVQRYKSDDYKRDFDWIDQITEVRDANKQQLLNDTVVQKLNSNDFGKMWMAVPEVVDWSDVKGFRYGRPQRGDLREDLDIPTFLGTLNGVPVTFDILTGQQVYMISAATDEPSARWSAFRCLYAEVAHGGELYILNSGKWYLVSADFSGEVLRNYADTATSSLALPDCAVNDEGAYNIATAQALTGACCMDRKVIRHGGGHSTIEFCDLFTTDKRLVHVKRYGASSVLSHLFAQGVVSGELFASDADFRQKLNAELPAGHKLAAPGSRPNTNEYEIVYAIISNSTQPLDIPFFSKVSLRTAKRRLASFGYKVAIKKVQKL